jgi:starch-binding outer membrane protein, SusD/RagB family
MKVNNLIKTILFGASITAISCTQLEVNEKDSVITSAGGSTTAKLAAADALGNAYAIFENYTDQQGVYALGEHTSAEMIPPTRGTDWGDNGVWRTLDQHTADGTNSWIINAWNDLNGAAYRCNEVLAAEGVKPTAQQIAEAKFLRAFFQWHVMDFWGQVPFRNVTDAATSSPIVWDRSTAFDKIVADAKEALPNLPKGAPASENRVANQAACNFLLAQLYLNKHIYKGAAKADNADLAEVVKYVDAIKGAGFAYEKDYFANWQSGGKSERIFSTNKGIGPQRRWCMTTHYSQETGGWNGFTTLAEFYDKFDAADPRRGRASLKDGSPAASGIDLGFLIGQQYEANGKKSIDERDKKDLIFSRDVVLSGCATKKGIRAIKYHPKTSGDYILMRLGAAQMMKIEALLRSGGDAKTAFNELRKARGSKELAAVTEQDVFDEWGRETYWEGHARTYEIRFGKYTTGAGADNKEAYTVLFPVPNAAITANPNLRQNPGYK